MQAHVEGQAAYLGRTEAGLPVFYQNSIFAQLTRACTMQCRPCRMALAAAASVL